MQSPVAETPQPSLLELEYERAFWGILAVLGRPSSYLDVYSATAWMARCARVAGISPSRAMVLTPNRKNYASRFARAFVCMTFGTEPFIAHEQFELVTCFGYADNSDLFVKNLASMTSHWLVIASLQPPHYRIGRYQAAGICYDHEATERLQCALDGVISTYWRPQYALVFKR